MHPLSSKHPGFVFLLAFTCISFFSNAQLKWAPQGATWHYRVSGEGTDGAIRFFYEKDTVVGTVTAQKINSTFYGWMYFYSPINGVSAYKQQVARVQDSVLYVNIPGTQLFDTVVDYKAVPGCSWLAPRRYMCSNRRLITVTDTGTFTLGNERLHSITVQYTTVDLATTVTYTTTFIEKIHNAHLRAPCFDMLAMSCDNPVPQTNCETARFLCYHDGDGSYYDPENVQCQYNIGMLEQQLQAKTLPFPNPCRDEFFVNAQWLGEWFLYNAQGARIQGSSYYSNGNLVIVTSQLEPGIYLLETRRGGVSSFHRIIRAP